MITVRKCTQRAIDLIKHFEHFSPFIYVCVGGYETGGWGHVVNPFEKDKFKNGISPEEGEEILIKNIKKAELSVCRLINIPLEDFQYDALCSWTFNLGGGALQRSLLRQCLNRGEYPEVSNQMRRWVYASGKKWPGLIKRRESEAILFEKGELIL